MSNLICLLGLSVAAMFAIVMYGPVGIDPAGGAAWVEYVVFGIIGVGTLPALKDMIENSKR